LYEKVAKLRDAGKTIDYLTFVADGEPTLDINLGGIIDMFRPLGIPIAVITNASIVWQEQVQEDLQKADWVSLKVDAVQKPIWKKVNRPHRSLQLDSVLEGLVNFAKVFQGKLATETMLVKDFNDDASHIASIGEFLADLHPSVSYLSVPIRPPAKKEIKPPSAVTLFQSFQQLQKKVDTVELLIGNEGNDFDRTGSVVGDLLSITAVHPMREDAVKMFLSEAGANWQIVKKLIDQDRLMETVYQGNRFYMRKSGL